MPIHVQTNRAFLYSLLLGVCLCFTSRLQARTDLFQERLITISAKNSSLSEILRQITKKSGITIYFVNSDVDPYKGINIDAKEEDINAVLHKLLDGRGLTAVMVSDRYIAVKKNVAPPEATMNRADTTIDLTGRVTDQKGDPIIGATVIVKGSFGNGATTDNTGAFKLKNVNRNGTLTISSVGFLTRDYIVNNRTTLGTISLQDFVSNLDETVVIAYGTTTQRFSTGDVGTLKAKDIARQPINNPLLALQGRIPGLFITQNSGLPGAGVTVRIQGQNSLNMGNDPLYVINGVPFTAQLLPGLGAVLAGSGGSNTASPTGTAATGNPLSYLNPNDIESIDVLKDADATAIYGSRAANGAILITTKKGKAGKTRADFNIRQGFGKIDQRLKLMNTTQYLEMRHELKRNDNAGVFSSDYDINGTWDTTRNVDWQKTLLGGTAKYTDAQVNLSGGSTNTQFLFGAGYHRETTVFPGDFSDQKGSLNFNFNNTSADERFKFQFTGNYMVDRNLLGNADLTGTARFLAPDAPELYNADGTINWAQTASGTSTWTNPISYILSKYKNNTSNLITNAVLSYQILPELIFQSSLGYTNLTTDEIVTVPITSFKPEDRIYSSNSADYSNSSMTSWIIEPQLNYKHLIGKGKLDVLLGTTLQHNSDNLRIVQGSNYNSDEALEDVRSAGTLIPVSSVVAAYKYNALFARLNYNWQDKYLINLSARRDGSSRFGPENQLHNFGSAGAAWIFSNEDFIKRSLPFLSFGKLRGSYGTTGNDQIGNYQFLSLFGPPFNVNGTYQDANSLAPNKLPNPYIQWEETKKLQFGLDLGFIKDRILFNTSYYRNRSTNQLLSYDLPYTTGFSGITANFPALIENKGWEFSLTSININGAQLQWSTTINITAPSNKLVSFPGLSNSSYGGNFVVGEPFTLTKVFHFLGVDPATGKYSFQDSQGKPTSSPNYSTDRTVLINTAPTLFGGMTNNISFKGFELNFSFQFAKQKANNYFFGDFYPGTANRNQPVTVLDRWQKAGDKAQIQKYTSDFNYILLHFNATGSDAGFADASYIRMKNVSLSWQFPAAWISRMKLQQARLFMQAQNLFTISNFVGFDPETLSTSTLPPLRTITLGLQLSL